MCFWVSLTRFTSGRSDIVVPRPRESLYFIYVTEHLRFRAERVKSRSVRDNCKKAETQHCTRTHSRQSDRLTVTNTLFFPLRNEDTDFVRDNRVRMTPQH